MWKVFLNDCVRWVVASVPCTAVVFFLIYHAQQGKRLSDHVELVMALAVGSLVMSFALYWLLGKVWPGRTHEQQET